MQQRVRKPHRGFLLRPPGNSPSRWHLTRGFTLFGVIIHEMDGIVNRKWKKLVNNCRDNCTVESN